MQVVITISIPDPHAEQIKKTIKKDAEDRSMSMSQFLLWCWRKGRNLK